MTLLPELGAVTDVALECPDPVVKGPQYGCKDAKVKGLFGRLGRQQFTANATYDSTHGTLAFSTRGMRIAGGGARINGRWLDSGWQIELQSDSARLAELRKVAAPWFELPADLAVDGRTTMTMLLKGAASLGAIEVSGKFSDVTANNTAGTIATDKLAFALDATLTPAGNDWGIRARIESNSGQAYSDPIFLDFGQNALVANLEGTWFTDSGLIHFAPLDVEQQGVVSGTITGDIDVKGTSMLRDLRIELRSLQFPGAFTTFIQPFLVATNFKDFTTSGRLSGTVELDAGAPAALDLQLADVTFDDKNDRVEMRQLSGHVAWISSARRGGVAGRIPQPQVGVHTWNGRVPRCMASPVARRRSTSPPRVPTFACSSRRSCPCSTADSIFPRSACATSANHRCPCVSLQSCSRSASPCCRRLSAGRNSAASSRAAFQK